MLGEAEFREIEEAKAIAEAADTYSSEEGPICPYCLKENASAGNDYWAEQAGEGDHDCHHCGKVFEFSVDYTTHYYAKPVTTMKGLPHDES